MFRVNEKLGKRLTARLTDLSLVILSLVEVIVSLTTPAKARGKLVLAIAVCSRSRGDRSTVTMVKNWGGCHEVSRSLAMGRVEMVLSRVLPEVLLETLRFESV